MLTRRTPPHSTWTATDLSGGSLGSKSIGYSGAGWTLADLSVSPALANVVGSWTYRATVGGTAMPHAVTATADAFVFAQGSNVLTFTTFGEQAAACKFTFGYPSSVEYLWITGASPARFENASGNVFEPPAGFDFTGALKRVGSFAQSGITSTGATYTFTCDSVSHVISQEGQVLHLDVACMKLTASSFTSHGRFQYTAKWGTPIMARWNVSEELVVGDRQMGVVSKNEGTGEVDLDWADGTTWTADTDAAVVPYAGVLDTTATTITRSCLFYTSPSPRDSCAARMP